MQLSQNALAVDLVLEYASHLLDGHFLASGFVDSAAHGAVTTLSEQFYAFIITTDFPVSEPVDSQPFTLVHLFISF